MQLTDYDYICNMIGSLSGIPVRIYKEDTVVFYYSTVNLVKDPVSIYQSDILAISDRIGYFLTDHFSYYGIINTDQYKIVIGPTRQVSDSTPALRELASQLDIPKEDMDDFIIAMHQIVHIPLERLMQILCFLNYALNNEKCFLQDYFIDDSLQEKLYEAMTRQDADRIFSNNLPEQNILLHNTYDLERNIMNMIRKGDSVSLSELLKKSSGFNIGMMADNPLRQSKNTFIVIATLASRSAIQGGMDPDDAFTLSDEYIQKCELLNDFYQINNLRYLMMMDFTKRVNQLQEGSQTSQLVAAVTNYINHHISEPITVEAMSKEFFMSRSYLSKRFKAESNITLTDFILSQKTEEAKRLLRYTNNSLIAISLYLGFSSPGHFSRVFRKYVSITPNEYRKKYIN